MGKQQNFRGFVCRNFHEFIELSRNEICMLELRQMYFRCYTFKYPEFHTDRRDLRYSRNCMLKISGNLQLKIFLSCTWEMFRKMNPDLKDVTIFLIQRTRLGKTLNNSWGLKTFYIELTPKLRSFKI